MRRRGVDEAVVGRRLAQEVARGAPVVVVVVVVVVVLVAWKKRKSRVSSLNPAFNRLNMKSNWLQKSNRLF